MLENWVVMPTRLPLIRRRCHVCASARFGPSGKFRVNANQKLIDVWLLALCTGCGETTKLTVLERTRVRAIPSGLLDRLLHDDPDLIAELLQDPAIQRRNRVCLDWEDAWRLDTGEPDRQGAEVIEVAVHFAARIPVRVERLIAEGLGLSRAEVERLTVTGNLVSAVKPSGKLSEDFTFTVKR
ncbi:DUF1062 domain-containing protein [Stackebrandtia nassauensis]|uniref:DUF1062 domain-containing protein n=1 Tax=Stackebrandtia nassauensis (strain DSM 44728 / CIP 108903 / NRRL B-16338 / NBRC 102104 / LLR-40K-21) TaxID=446470 RepID=D3Q1D2_STANL|nr:DUF1062 domain-containing protein [Stackebrandtia nassauensis]ADD45712.1 conserved hypothetical protein [Stackebrandtia nassauensis DSM 44728]